MWALGLIMTTSDMVVVTLLLLLGAVLTSWYSCWVRSWRAATCTRWRAPTGFERSSVTTGPQYIISFHRSVVREGVTDDC